MNPQDAFTNLLIAAMKDAAIEGKNTQLQVRFDPYEGTRKPVKLETLRIIVVPEKLPYTWPAGAGTPPPPDPTQN